MSYCKKEGKDKVIFVSQEDHESLMKDEIISILDEDPTEQAEGLILPSGDINWNCPCLGGMPSGPCGPEFREAFSCFHYSEADPKGSDCLEKFRDMQECMSGYPELYPAKEVAESEGEGAVEDAETEGGDSAVEDGNLANTEQQRDHDANEGQEEKAS